MHPLNILFLVLISHQFPYVADAFRTTHPIRLTGNRKDGLQSLEYSSMDQCMPYMRNPKDAGSYGLAFRLPEGGGRCDFKEPPPATIFNPETGVFYEPLVLEPSGILICYPGVLDDFHVTGGRGPGMAVHAQFNVNNKEDHPVTKMCKNFWKKNGADKTKRWHGIHVYTRMDSGGRRLTMLHMSIQDQPYSLGENQREFTIQFGSTRSLVTRAIVNGNPMLFKKDEEDRLAFRERSRTGEMLEKYVGLWMLGLDILPYKEEDFIELHVYRGCKCTMEAWLLHPTDTVSPRAPIVPSAGSASCPPLHTSDKLKISGLDKEDQSIQFLALTDANPKEIVVSLGEADGSGKIEQLMAFNLTTAQLQTFIKDKGVVTDPTVHLANGTQRLELEVGLHAYCFEFRLNGKLLGEGAHWPSQWWKGIPIRRINAGTISGDILLLEYPKFKTIDPYPTVRLPFATHVQEIRSGSNLTFRFKIPDTAGEFNISLLHDRPAWHPYIGATDLQLNAVLNGNSKLRSYHDGQWNQSEEQPFNIQFEKGNAYELLISVQNNSYDIFVNGTMITNYANSMPIWATNFIRVEGALNLLDKPIVVVPPATKKDFSKKFETLLNYFDAIVFSGKVSSNAKEINIFLMHEAAEWNKNIGDIIVQLTFKFGDPSQQQNKQIFGSTRLHAETNATQPTLIGVNELSGGQNLEVKISTNANGFIVSIHGDDAFVGFYQFYKPADPSVASEPIPPWAVDHILITGDAEVDQVQVLSCIGANNKRGLEFLQVNASAGTGMMQPSDRIVFTMHIESVTEANFSVEINFFNEALAFHDLIGKTVLKIALNATYIGFNSYFNKTWLNAKKPISLKSGWLNGLKELRVDIQVKDQQGQGFDVQLADNNGIVGTYPYPEMVPVWAVQYITMEHKGLKLKSDEEVFWEPLERIMLQKNVTLGKCPKDHH